MSANISADLGRRAPMGTGDLTIGTNSHEGPSRLARPTRRDVAESVGGVDRTYQFPALTDDVRARCAEIIGE